MFASKTTREIAVGDETVTIRKLSAYRLEQARTARQKALAELGRAIGTIRIDAEDLKQYQSEQNRPKTEDEEKRGRNAAYDRLTVLEHGVVSWTVEEKLTRERLEDLDEAASRLLFEQILDLSLDDDAESPKG